MHYADRLQAAIDAKGAPVCAGFDPRPDWIPPEFIEKARRQHGATPAAARAAVRAFCLEVLELVAPHVPAIKPNSAFFEALGPEGLIDLSSLIARARELGLLVISDVKRGDMGTTAEAYAAALFGKSTLLGIEAPSMQTDAATINPYLGADAVQPFIDRARDNHCGLYVLARTSNPGSGEFQLLELKKGGTLVDEVAAKIDAWGAPHLPRCGYSFVGAVVGATHADSAARMRELMPRTPFLVPGWGAQGGSAEVVRACFDKQGRGAIVNSSRGIMHAYASGPLKHYGAARWRDAVVEAAKIFHGEIGALLK